MSERAGNGELSGKLNNKKIIRIFLWAALVSFAVTLISYLIHDVKLNVEIIKLGISDVPEIRLENIKFERDISGSHWKINIPSLERQRGVVRISSIDVFRELSHGAMWEIRGNDGEYIESSEIAEFNDISGLIEVDGQVFKLYAPCILWEKSGDLVTFSKGFAIRGEFSSISADKAKVEAGNLITIEEGGEIIWNISSYDIKT